MWDLETLNRLNDEAHYRAMEILNDKKLPSKNHLRIMEVLGPAPVFPLSELARKLLGGPPSLAYFAELLEQGETYKAFLSLVREYLPAHEVTIMGERLDRRALKFCRLFSKEYFPLAEDILGNEINTESLVFRIPIVYLGLAPSIYHEFIGLRPGYIMLMSLVMCPWDSELFEDELEYDPENATGARVPIILTMKNIVGDELARHIPDDGWSPNYLHDRLDGTDFKGAALFADWVFGMTGSTHLDTCGESNETGTTVDWDPLTVEELTDDWKLASGILDCMHDLAFRLEEEPKNNFRKLIMLLVEDKEKIIPIEQLPLLLAAVG